MESKPEQRQSASSTGISGTERLEYEQANEWWRALSSMRRRDLALFTTIEGAIITIIREQLLNLQADGIILGIIGFLVALVGANNERRLYRYLFEFRERAMKIEDNNNMTLLRSATNAVLKLKVSLENSLAFRSYYICIAIIWVVIWILQAFQLSV